jgi:hypothetical protein
VYLSIWGWRKLFSPAAPNFAIERKKAVYGIQRLMKLSLFEESPPIRGKKIVEIK